MAHAAELREKAFKLWMEGQSYDQICASLDIAKQTVVRWAKGDKTRGELSWENRRQRITTRAQDRTDEDIAATKARIIRQLRKIQNHFLEQVLEMEISSAEGGAYALLGAIKQEIALTGDKITDTQLVQKVVEKVVPRAVVATCEFLSDEESVRQKIESRRDELVSVVVENLLRFASEEFRKV